MPKSIFVDPKKVRKQGEIVLPSIPVNSYSPDSQKELKKFGKKRLNKIYHDMVLIREFESMLNSIKTEGAYQGIEYTHGGPAHLSIGQESTSVGQCAVLDIDDYIFGSHRSHGEILAKCLSAIEKTKDAELLQIMQSYMGGGALAVVEKDAHESTADLAIDYVLYTDSVLVPVKSFVLATDSMDPKTLKRHGLKRGDAVEASDHYPVVADFRLLPDGE